MPNSKISDTNSDNATCIVAALLLKLTEATNQLFTYLDKYQGSHFATQDLSKTNPNGRAGKVIGKVEKLTDCMLSVY